MAGSSVSAAAPLAVEITTEQGEQITRFVPATSQTRQIAIFSFEVTNEKDNWSQLGFPYLLSKDLEQDMRLYAKTPGALEYDMKSFGYDLGDKIPFSTMLKIANKSKVDYFMSGEILEKNNEGWSIKVNIFESGSGAMFKEQIYTSADIFSFVDDCTIDVRGSMFLKDNNSETESYVDLPASNLITENLEALELFFKGRKAEFYEEQYEKGAKLFQKAAELDPKSAEIKRYLAYAINALGNRDAAKEIIAEALDQSKQLPERQQFAIKQSYWGMNDNMDNVLVLMNNWIKLYPQDYDPHEDLINFYNQTFQLTKAKEIAALARENGHKNRVIDKLVDLSIRVEDFDDAEKYLKEYYEAYPELAKEDMRMGEVHYRKGEFKKASDFYQNLILNDPQNSKIFEKMGENNFANGKFEDALKNYALALRYSDQAPDSTSTYIKLMIFHGSLGQSSKFNENFDQLLISLRSYMPETSVASTVLQLTGLATVSWSKEHCKNYFNNLYSQYPQMKSTFECVSNFLFSLYGNNVEELKKYNQGECKAIVVQGSPDLEFFVNCFLNSMEGNHKESIINFNKFIEKSGAGGKDFGYLLSKEYRAMNQPEKAIKYCQDFLRTSPYNGVFLMELSLAQLAAGKKAAAAETYKKLENIWKSAEPSFIYYNQFKELGQSLGL